MRAAASRKTAWMAVVGLATVHDIGFTPRTTTLSERPGEMNKVLQASLTVGWLTRPVRLLMIVSLIYGAFMMWAFYAWQPYFLDLLGRDAVWVAGVIAALIALSTIAGNGLVDYRTRFCGRRTTLLVAASAVLAVAAAAVGLVDSFGSAVVHFLVAMAAIGVVTPVQQAYLHAVVPSAERATVVSFASLLGSAGGIGGSLGLGYLARLRSVATGDVTGGLMMLLAPPPLLALRALRQPADVIVGRRAGRPLRAPGRESRRCRRLTRPPDSPSPPGDGRVRPPGPGTKRLPTRQVAADGRAGFLECGSSTNVVRSPTAPAEPRLKSWMVSNVA
jgi:MFS family permease